MLIRRVTGLALAGLVLVFFPAATGAAAAETGAGHQRTEARPDLVVSLNTTLPDWPDRTIKVSVKIKNVGGADCGKSSCQVFVRHAHPPRQTLKIVKKTVRPLGPDDFFIFAFSFEPGLGLFEIEAVADPRNKIGESDESNNRTKVNLAGR